MLSPTTLEASCPISCRALLLNLFLERSSPNCGSPLFESLTLVSVLLSNYRCEWLSRFWRAVHPKFAAKLGRRLENEELSRAERPIGHQSFIASFIASFRDTIELRLSSKNDIALWTLYTSPVSLGKLSDLGPGFNILFWHRQHTYLCSCIHFFVQSRNSENISLMKNILDSLNWWIYFWYDVYVKTILHNLLRARDAVFI